MMIVFYLRRFVLANTFMSRCETFDNFNLEKFERGKVHKFKLSLLTDQLGDQVQIPVVVIRGKKKGPRVTITAAVHGDEINGTYVCFKLIHEIKPEDLCGDLVIIPIVNVLGFKQNRRLFPGRVDLNRVMPGKEKDALPGEIFASHFFNQIIKGSDYLFDLHTASKGRINTLYTRVNLDFKNNRELIKYQKTPIILNNKGPDASLRKAAEKEGIQAITIEIGNPNIYQKKNVRLATTGILDTLFKLNVYLVPREIEIEEKTICQASEWIRTTTGGLIEVEVDLYERVLKGQRIGVIKDAFGHILDEYLSPYDSIVIGKEINPVCIAGDRIVHLGKL